MNEKMLSCVKAPIYTSFLRSSVKGKNKFDIRKQEFTVSEHPETNESGVKMNVYATLFPLSNKINTQQPMK